MDERDMDSSFDGGNGKHGIGHVMVTLSRRQMNATSSSFR